WQPLLPIIDEVMEPTNESMEPMAATSIDDFTGNKSTYPTHATIEEESDLKSMKSIKISFPEQAVVEEQRGENDVSDAGDRISVVEEFALMKLLNLYSHTLNVNTAPILLDVLMATDKFEVVSYKRYYSGLGCIITMTYEYALMSLELHSSILMARTV
ncbi:hypothetical protein RYX36_011786, partial [Vicia faba]